MRRRGFPKAFYIMILSYLLVLAIPLLCACTFYIQAEKRIRAQQQAYATSTLVRARDIADTLITDANAVLLSAMRDERTKSVLALSGEPSLEDSYKLYMLARRMTGIISSTDSMIGDVYLFMENIGRVFTTSTIYPMRQFFSASGFTEEQAREFTDVLYGKRYFNEYKFLSTPVPWERAGERAVCLLTLPVSIGEPRGVAAMLIDTSALNSQLESIQYVGAGCALVLDDAGAQIACVGDERLADIARADSLSGAGEKRARSRDGSDVSYSISRVLSPVTGWSYVSVLPENEIMAMVIELRRYLTLFVLFMLAVGAALAFLFSRRHTHPLVELSRMIALGASGADEGAPQNDGDIRDITRRVRRLIEYDAQLKNHVENVEVESRRQAELWQGQRETISDTLLLKLLSGAPGDASYYLSQLSALGIAFPHPLYMAVVSECAGALPIGDIPSGALIAMTTVDTQGHFCTILNFADDRLSSLPGELFQRLSRRAADKDADAYFGVSDVRGAAEELGEAYREAVLSLNYCHMLDVRVAQYSHIDAGEGAYSYPIESELKLINAVCAGDAPKALSELDEIVNLNMGKKLLSLEMIRCFMYDLSATLARASDALGDREGEAPIAPERFRTFAAFLSEMRERVRRMCACAEGRKKSRNTQLRDALIADIAALCGDSRLSVAYLADRHGISASYLSRFFKEQTGQNLLDAINRARVEVACEMLSEGKLTIAAISQALGYADDSSFGRVFRKYMHATPGEYRKNGLSQSAARDS